MSADLLPCVAISNLHQALDHAIWQRWPETIRKNNKTYLGHHYTVKQFTINTQPLVLAGLLPERASEEVQRFLDLRRFRGFSACAIDNDRRNLSSDFAWLIRARILLFRANPAHKTMVSCDRVDVRCKRPLTDTEVCQLLNATRNTKLHLSVLLCLAAGLRPRGASRVRREDLDLDGRTLIVREKKRERIVPLSAWIVAEIQRWLRLHPWEVYHVDTAAHMLKDVRDIAQLPAHITMQALRRTFLRKLFEKDISPQLAANLCGNSIQVIQKHYVELETLNARSVVDVLDFGEGKV